MICISCGKEHNENYCSNCGEKSYNSPISFVTFIKDSFSLITNMDKGFLFNIKALLINPKKLIYSYINGKRKGIFNPISFLFINITIYLIVANFLKVPKTTNHSDIYLTNDSIKPVTYQIGVFIRTYLKYFWIFSIVPLAISLKLFFRKYNFMEHLAISCFIIGQATIAAIISHICFRLPLIFDPIVYLLIIFQTYRIFKTSDKTESFLMALANIFVFIFLLISIVIFIGIIKFFF